MQSERLAFLKQLMDTIAPTGYEAPAARVWTAEAARFAERTWIDVHGNAFASVNESGSPRIMLAGHIDEIGLMISHIDENGFLYVTPLGGWDPQVLPGQRVRISTDSGILLGVIGRKAVHLLDEEARKKVVKIEDLWIDIAAKDADEAKSLVSIGDPAVLDYGFAELRNGILAARGFDDRIGAFVALEAARLVAEMNPSAAVYAVATVQEEIGLRGAHTSAFGIDPHVGIAIDVGHTTDTPEMGTEKKKLGPADIGKGPIVVRGPNINPQLFRCLVETAKVAGIPFQIQGYPRGTGTDANAIQLTRSGVATGLIDIPNRYMHSPCELVHIDDLENAAKLIAHAIALIDETTSFIPE